MKNKLHCLKKRKEKKKKKEGMKVRMTRNKKANYILCKIVQIIYLQEIICPLFIQQNYYSTQSFIFFSPS